MEVELEGADRRKVAGVLLSAQQRNPKFLVVAYHGRW